VLIKGAVLTYKHNDVADLERALQAAIHGSRGRPLNRRFIVCEGISHAAGDAAPIAAIYALKRRYKFRLVVDESLSFGVYGATGRGICEAAGLAPQDVEIITGSLGTALMSNGGWCVGARAMVDHQRLSSGGYCFSAALPPMLASAALNVLDRFEAAKSAPAAAVRHRARQLRAALAAVPGVSVLGSRAVLAAEDVNGRSSNALDQAAKEGAALTLESPVVVLEVLGGEMSREASLLKVAAVRDAMLDNSRVFVGLERPTDLQKSGGLTTSATLKITVTAAHTEQDVSELVAALSAAVGAAKHSPSVNLS
jgi:7-keto-8-aminopelargonate synthetase-like enzyme